MRFNIIGKIFKYNLDYPSRFECKCLWSLTLTRIHNAKLNAPGFSMYSHVFLNRLSHHSS